MKPLQLYSATILLLLFTWSCTDNSNEPSQTLSVSGRITSTTDGSAISAATVEALNHENSDVLSAAVTNDDGEYLLEGLPSVKMDMRVQADGFAPQIQPLYDPTQDGTTIGSMNLQLESLDSSDCCSGTLTVYVRDAANNPLTGVRLRVWRNGAVVTKTWSNSSGIAVVDSLCRGEYGVDLDLDGYTDREFMFAVNAECDPVTKEVTMESVGETCCDGKLFVVVKDEHQSPVAGATVKLWQNGVVLHTTQTNANGIAQIDSLCKGEYGVDVWREGYTPREFAFAINAECDPVEKHVVVETLVCCDGVFKLIVRDGQGNPVQGALVLIRRGEKVIEDPRTDANGKIIVDGLCKGEYNYRISKDGYSVVEGVFAINENCDPVVKEATLESVGETCCSGMLTVLVRDQSNAPVAGALVKLRQNGVIVTSAYTNANGIVTLDSLCQGFYDVVVKKENYTPREVEFAINENCDPVTREVTVETLACCDGVFTLVVRDGQGNPVQGAVVLIRKGEKVIEDPRTDANGKIVVDGLCKGEYNYRVSKEGFSVIEGEFSINENCDPVTMERTITEICCSGVLTVVVVDSSSAAVEGAKVKIWRNGAVLETTTTGIDGKAVFDGLCKGEYGVDVRKEGLGEREFMFAINSSCDPVSETVSL